MFRLFVIITFFLTFFSVIPANAQPAEVENWFSSGLSALDNKEYNRAVHAFSQVLKKDPYFMEAYLLRGIAYGDGLNQYEKAIADFNNVLKIDPGNADAYGLRGTTYAKLGQHDKAIADYAEAIRLNPGDASNYALRAKSWRAQGNLKSALVDAQQANRLEPEDTDYQSMVAELQQDVSRQQTAKTNKKRQTACFISNLFSD